MNFDIVIEKKIFPLINSVNSKIIKGISFVGVTIIVFVFSLVLGFKTLVQISFITLTVFALIYLAVLFFYAALWIIVVLWALDIIIRYFINKEEIIVYQNGKCSVIGY